MTVGFEDFLGPLWNKAFPVRVQWLGNRDSPSEEGPGGRWCRVEPGGEGGGILRGLSKWAGTKEETDEKLMRSSNSVGAQTDKTPPQTKC